MLFVLQESSNCVRFYGSSVLIVYCAEAADKGEVELLKVKMVDFQKAQIDKDHGESDKDSERGVGNLIKELK